MKYKVYLSASEVYKVEIEAKDYKEAEEKVLHMWREESHDWRNYHQDTTDLVVSSFEMDEDK